MPPLNKRRRQPIAALVYTSLGAALVAFVIFYLGFTLTTSQTLSGAVPPHLTALLFAVIFIAAFVTLAYPVLHYLLFSYEIGEHALSVYSGIIFRQHETINFARIQSIENERGPVLALFGLTLMEVWTASPNQHVSSPAAQPRPDTVIYLTRDEASALKSFMLQRPSAGSI